MLSGSVSLKLGPEFGQGTAVGMSLDPLAGGVMAAAGWLLPSGALMLLPSCCLRCTTAQGAQVTSTFLEKSREILKNQGCAPSKEGKAKPGVPSKQVPSQILFAKSVAQEGPREGVWDLVLLRSWVEGTEPLQPPLPAPRSQLC